MMLRRNRRASRPSALPLPGWLRAVAVLVLSGGAVIGVRARAQTEIGAARVTPNLVGNIDRPLRYRPDHGDFVIENGTECFNRSLYGGNTAFRVDGGDKPEFVLYLPGRGGNLRFGIVSRGEAKWMDDAAQIETRYRPGELLYAVRDPLLGPAGKLELAALAYSQTEGLVVRIEASGVAPGVVLVWAFGGVNGERGKRDGDIGTESVPISQWFQLRPEFCRGNEIEVRPTGFVLRAKPATIVGVTSAPAQIGIASAADWNQAEKLVREKGGPKPAVPVVLGRMALENVQAGYLSLQKIEEPNEGDRPGANERREVAPDATQDLPTYREVTAKGRGERLSSAGDYLAPGPAKIAPLAAPYAPGELANEFGITERHFAALRGRVAVETPDPYLNAVVGALNVAADALWDEPQRVIMHGAIAWRTKLLGWRGPYVLDALGWHDRARENFAYWVGRQNTDPIRPGVPPPEEKWNLARNEAGLHTNGDLSNSHYDMNLVFIDALFRHLQWTGDLEFARRVWPVIQRHLAWEYRLFRREYGPEKLPLYEAYAAIWASDDLQYSGGGTAHASAYNYYENRQAARLARLIGEDPAPYDREADLIAKAMRQLLWVTPEIAAREGFDIGATSCRDGKGEGEGANEEGRGVKPLLQGESTNGNEQNRGVKPLLQGERERTNEEDRGVKPLLQGEGAGANEEAVTGWFAEYKDWLGLQRVHPSAALWTFYHTIDSEVATPEEAWQMTQYVDAAIPHLPVRGPGVPNGLCTLATSDWMPYDWSINNVVMAEAVHAALAFWEAGRPDEAWSVTKGSVLAAMFMGISPGNVGSMSYLDVYRRESQRDFGDGAGVLARALIEGLFGVKPDALAGELRVAPGWPVTWNDVALRHPDFSLEFHRRGETDAYRVTQVCHPADGYQSRHLGGPDLGAALRRDSPKSPLNSSAVGAALRRDPVDGSDFGSKGSRQNAVSTMGSVGFPRPLTIRLRVIAPRDRVARVTVNGRPASWHLVADSVGRPRIEIQAVPDAVASGTATTSIEIQWAGDIVRPANPPNEVAPTVIQGTGDAIGLFASIEQGQMRWMVPVTTEVGRRDAEAEAEAVGAKAANRISAGAESGGADLTAGPVDERKTSRAATRFDPVDLTGIFNDRVTRIFKHEYRSPRSPFVSLALPKQGIGGWAGGVNRTAAIDDSGLRAAAARGGGKIVLVNGLPLRTPADPNSPNVAFTSQWDNYPRHVGVSLAGRARGIYLLLAGSTGPMQSRFENGRVVVAYVDGTEQVLPLVNPTNWWPIEQDYFTDDFQFRRTGPLPTRIDLATGKVRTPALPEFKGRGGAVRGGAATLLYLPLDPEKALKTLTIGATANDSLVGLMAATLVD